MNDENENQILNGSISTRIKIDWRVIPIRQEFYLVTKEQIDSYSDMGFFASLFLTLFGLFGGGTISCWVGTQQANMPDTLLSTIHTALMFCILSAAIFLSLSIVFIVKQRTHKKTILQSYVEVEDFE
jgi:apolipoprotein N-acyltransferase